MQISRDSGIVVRRAAPVEKEADLSAVMRECKFADCFDESDRLVSLGPFFGGDAADACMRLFERLGRVDFDDGCIVEETYPGWCEVEAF